MYQHEVTGKNILMDEIKEKLQKMTDEQKRKVLEYLLANDEEKPA